MNPITIICYNTAPAHLPMTLDAIESAVKQDIGDVTLFVTDNGSTDDTWEKIQDLEGPRFFALRYRNNISPLKIANKMLHHLFRDCGYQYVLCIPNDVVLPRNLYMELLKYPRGFVTASMTDDRDFVVPEKIVAVNECTPMAVILVRRWAYEAIMAKDGYFLCEEYFHYYSDNDLALRMAACGIRGVQLNIPYWHSLSASLKLAGPEVAQALSDQGHIDGMTFHAKWGFSPRDPQYTERALDINFKG
jgi:GT2 family glycosyltransferase